VTPDERVRELLEQRGVPRHEIEQAAREGRLHLLVVDVVLFPRGPSYTPTEVAERSGMPIDQIETFWRALGFPNTGRDDPAFGPADLDAVTTLHGLLTHDIADIDSSVQLARVLGSSMARVAEAEIGASPMLRGDEDNLAQAELFALTAEATLPSMARLLEYAWRRHLQAAARRSMALTGVLDSGGGVARLAVGFADLVGFTVLSQQLSEEQLAEMVRRFEALAYDTVTVLGGRVVKMIGDEAMYVADTPAIAAEVALSLSEAYADDEILSDVRVGVAFGEVLARDGDYYGPVVNRASRIVNIAAPGTILVSDEVRAALADHEGYEWRSLRPRPLKDLGRVHLWRLARTGAAPPSTRSVQRSRLNLPRPDMRLGPERLLERVERLRSSVGKEDP
jgi:adenylate cyclase